MVLLIKLVLRRAAILLTTVVASANVAFSFELKGTELTATETGRHYLRYIIECALPKFESVKFTASGKEFIIKGSLGLAPLWRERALTRGEQELVSSCIYARVNAWGVKVPISMRTPMAAISKRSGLQTTRAEVESYSFFEGAFFGNIFLENSPGYACHGGQLSEEFIQNLIRHKRICTLPSYWNKDIGVAVSECGFIVVGSCDQAHSFSVNGMNYSFPIQVFLNLAVTDS